MMLSDIQNKTFNNPPLYILNGTGCDDRLFEVFTAHFIKKSPETRVVIINVGELSSLDNECERLEKLVPDHSVLAGFSLGGIVALNLYMRNKLTIDKLILINSTARADSAENKNNRDKLVNQLDDHNLFKYITDAWPIQVAKIHENNDVLKQLLIDMVERAGKKRLMNQMSLIEQRPCSLNKLNKIRHPTLIMSGIEDSICHHEIQLELLNNIPAAKLMKVKDAGHFLPLEQPRVLAENIHTFIFESSC